MTDHHHFLFNRQTLVLTITIFSAFIISFVVCPAIPSSNNNNNKDKHDDPNKVELEDDLGLEYGRYLQEVVSLLETDKEFAAKLENASSDAIESGAVANHLDLVDHQIRGKLDELKRMELDRLHKLTMKEKHLRDQLEHDQSKDHGHIDKQNPHSFEIEDLHRLIKQATRDLEKIDQKKQQEFKEYEMKKELEFRSKLAAAPNDTVRQQLIQEREQLVKKHKDHQQINEPGTIDQLTNVWENVDHLPKNEFDPKTFFKLHDVNDDGYLDESEVEALLQLEIAKMYDPKNFKEGEDDPIEMKEELRRMRAHVYQTGDHDRDGLISLNEFIRMVSVQQQQQHQQPSNVHRNEWKELDEVHEPDYNEKELNEYYKRMHELQMQYQQQGGIHPGQPGYHPGQGYPVDPNQYYYYEHAPPPPQYYQQQGHPMGAGQQGHPVGGQQQVQYYQQQQQQQPQYYGQPQHPQQVNQLNAQQQQQLYQQVNEQLMNFNGQVYHVPQGINQQQQQQQQFRGGVNPPPPPQQVGGVNPQQPMNNPGLGHQQQQQIPQVNQQPNQQPNQQQKIGVFPPTNNQMPSNPSQSVNHQQQG